MVKNPPANAGDIRDAGQKDPLDEGLATHSSILAWKTPLTEGPGRRHRFDHWVGKISWSRKQQTTPVFLPGKLHGERSLAGHSPWGHKESNMIVLLMLYPL